MLPSLVCFPRVVKRPILDLGWITLHALRRHLDFLHESGCAFVDLRCFLERGSKASGPEVVVAFGDQGPEFLEQAWPVLHGLRIQPVLFVHTALVGRVRRPLLPGRAPVPHLGWSELGRLIAEGASVQSAGHYGLDASRVPAEMMFGDLIRSRRELENRLGEPPVALWYPYDAHGDVASQVARQAGFELAFAAGIQPPFQDRLRLGRIPVGTFSHRDSVLRHVKRPARVMSA